MLYANLNVHVTNIAGKVIKHDVYVLSEGFHMKIMLLCNFFG
jgi:hypothetical protein